MYNKSQTILQTFCLSLINLIYSALDTDRQVWSALIILKLSYFGEKIREIYIYNVVQNMVLFLLSHDYLVA